MKEYLNIEELSEYLGIKKSTLYAKVESRQIPFYKIGHLIRFKKAEIDCWMEGLKQIPFDASKKANEVIKGLNSRKVDIDTLMKKCIESARGKGYNPSSGKPDQSLGKEGDDGTV